MLLIGQNVQLANLIQASMMKNRKQNILLEVLPVKNDHGVVQIHFRIAFHFFDYQAVQHFANLIWPLN